jgi:hypothetical protein
METDKRSARRGEIVATNMERYKKDPDALLKLAGELENAMQYECMPKEFEAQFRETIARDPEVAKTLAVNPSNTKHLSDVVATFIKRLPSFNTTYQSWYSEAKAIVRQLLPDRLADFVRHYEKPKPRKSVSYESYRIEDYFQSLTITKWGNETVVSPSAAIPHFRQQVAIVKAVRARFESSLFDIRQLVQADLLDSELDAARELAKHKFCRAAGAVSGVVLEKHLAQICENHAIKITKAKPTINDFNEALKSADVIDVPAWRFIQHLADIRNLCDHNKKTEPTVAQVDDLVEGVAKVSKTLF